MESYCLIQFKDKDEKKQVLTLLMDTEVDFKVTTDLKGLVAKLFNVTILENVVVSLKANDTITSKDVTINNIIDVPLLIDNNTDTFQIEQQTPIQSASNGNAAQQSVAANSAQNSMDSQSSSINVPSAVIDNSQKSIETKTTLDTLQNRQHSTPIPVIDNTQYLMNMDDYGTYVPYLERPEIESKVDIEDNFADVAPSTINALQNRQHSTSQSFSVPDPIVVDQPIRVIDNSQNLIDMDDYGTSVPYLERLVELKREITDDEHERGEGLDEELINDNISVDAVPMSNQTDIPASSTTRRSGRVAKKPRYSMDDSSDEEYTPLTKYSKKNGQVTKKIDTPPIKSVKKSDQVRKSNAGYESKKESCKKCGAQVRNRYSKKIEHIMTHTDIKRFECTVAGCGFKAFLRNYTSSHNRTKHPSQSNCFKEIQLTPEQTMEIETIIKECFDSLENNGEKCQVCWQSVGGTTTRMINAKRDHSDNHLNFMIYKCMEDRCSFESKTESSMKLHAGRSHEKRQRYQKIDLTADQKMKIEGIFSKCFPLMDNDESVA